jgi:salicylate hydroxylase
LLTRYLCRNSAGDILDQQPLPVGTRCLRRRDLICALMAALNGQVPILYDAELDHVERDGSGSIHAAVLSSGEAVMADLYVAADGSRSKARTATFPNWPSRCAPVAEIVGMLRCKDAVRWAGQDFNKFHAAEGGLALGIVPVAADHVVWFLQFDVQRFNLPPDSPEGRLGFAESLLAGWGEPIPHLLAHTDYSRVHLWRPVDCDLIPQFYSSNLVLVGDAAHPMLPFTSRGVSSAIGDVIVLAQELRSGGDLQHALYAYSAQRRAECAPYISKGRELTSYFMEPLRRAAAVVPLAI